MTTLEIILISLVALLVFAVAFLYVRGGSHMNELEDELYPECKCKGIKKT